MHLIKELKIKNKYIMTYNINKDAEYKKIYENIYNSSLESYETIVNKFPIMKITANTNSWIQKLKDEQPNMTEKEMVAHNFTMSIMMYLMNQM